MKERKSEKPPSHFNPVAAAAAWAMWLQISATTKIELPSSEAVKSDHESQPGKKEHQRHPAVEYIFHQVDTFFSQKTLLRRIPVIKWLSQYKLSHLQCDLVAGFTVGLTVIPQGMAYALIAGLPLQYGLYSSFMGCFVYCLFGTVPQVNIGPTAIMGLLTVEQTKIGGPGYAILLSFVAGLVIMAIGALNLGFLIDFISTPVVSAFCSAAALVIATTQLKGLTGIKVDSDGFIDVISHVLKNIQSCNVWDLVLGIICIICLLILRKLTNIVSWLMKLRRKDSVGDPLSEWKILSNVIWFISISRNAIVVMIASGAAYGFYVQGLGKITITGEFKGGLPPFALPNFTQTVGNQTKNFVEIGQDFGSSIIMLPLVAILEHIAIAKVFAKGKMVDAKQELLVLGLSNVMSSFVSAFPTTGSFSRAALSNSCNVKTPLSGIVTGSLILLALSFMAPYFKYIPKSTLSAVIMCAVIFMVEIEMIPMLWKTSKLELIIFIFTVLCCLGIGTEYGIIIGIGVTLLVLLYYSARPNIVIRSVKMHDIEYMFIQPEQNLYFPTGEHLRYLIEKSVRGQPKTPIVFDGTHIQSTDYTVANGLRQISDDFIAREQMIIFTNLKCEVLELVKKLHPKDFRYCSSQEDVDAALKSHLIEISIDPNGYNPSETRL